MKHRAFVQNELFIVVAIIAIVAGILFPVFGRARDNVRRRTCQSNLKGISMGVSLYARDFDDFLPPRAWRVPVSSRMATSKSFDCPSAEGNAQTSDYFFNAQFVNKRLGSIKSPATLVLFGDGHNAATLAELPAAWRTDENSPSYRHLQKSNYLFADGHIKSLKVNRVSRDFRMVNP